MMPLISVSDSDAIKWSERLLNRLHSLLNGRTKARAREEKKMAVKMNTVSAMAWVLLHWATWACSYRSRFVLLLYRPLRLSPGMRTIKR